MSRAIIRYSVLVAVILAAVAAGAAPALCQELQLAGVKLGDTPQDLISSPAFGFPDAMYTSGNAFSFVRAQGVATPVWAVAVRMDNVGADQQQWVYNRDPVAIGVLLTGSGINAHVTDIVVTQWRTFAPSKVAETEKGIRLGDTFADVLEQYGWPNRFAIVREAPTRMAPQAPQAAQAPNAPMPGSRPLTGEEEEPDRGGPAALPSVGPSAPIAVSPGGAALTGPTTPPGTAQAGGMSFTNSCILSYPSVDFVLYRMKVFRINIYGR